MSYGKAVSFSFGDGTEADLVREGVNGAFFPKADVAGLRARIMESIAQPYLRQEMGQASLAIVRNEMTIREMVDTLMRALPVITILNPKVK